MFGNRTHLDQTKKYITAFATLFNDLSINPYVPPSSGLPSKEMTVPIAFGPKEKWLAILRQDPDKQSQQLALPRMGFEISGFSYEPEKNFQPTVKRHVIGDKFYLSPANYRIDITLSIIAKYHEDVFSIIEQIIPYFRPKLTVKIKTLDDESKSSSMAVDLNSVSPEVEYEGSFEEKRVVIYTLSFSITAAYWIGNSSAGNGKLITKAIANYRDISGNLFSKTSVYPGVDEEGNPVIVTEDIDYNADGEGTPVYNNSPMIEIEVE